MRDRLCCLRPKSDRRAESPCYYFEPGNHHYHRYHGHKPGYHYFQPGYDHHHIDFYFIHAQ